MTKKKKDPARVAAGKKAWRNLSPAKKAATKKRLAKFRFTKGAGTSAGAPRPASTPAPRGGSTGETKKRKKVDPIPVIGVRGSSTKISVAKTAGVVGVASVALITPAGRSSPAIGAKRDIETTLAVAQERAGQIWEKHSTKILVGGGLILIFGKAFDRRYPDMPIRLGR